HLIPLLQDNFCAKQIQRDILHSISKNPNLIFNSCDKGGGLACTTRSGYDGEIQRQLSDTDSYCKLKGDLTVYKTDMYYFLSRAHEAGDLTDEERGYLINKRPTKAAMYILPKTHKDCQEPLFHVIDFHIRPLVTKLPSYLRDTGDFINQLS
uniref:Uncharacterized protein n=1 Tax=Oncorhynchus mykiss TaxID=8022 RepID=A0A8C7NQ08_ONCMY